MKNLKLALLICSTLITSNALGFGKDRIKKLNWNGIEVTWLQDERFPTYSVSFHFADGSLSDHPKRKGETYLMFNLIDSGTRRFGQKDISDNLEFYGTNWGPYVTHESSIYEISGLVKDLDPSMKKICHIFKDASFPKRELSKTKRALKSSAISAVNNHSMVASSSFRELSLSGTPYSYPVAGKVKDRKRISSADLKRKLNYFNTKVKKKIYISGPKEVLKLENIITRDCGWSGESGDYERVVEYKKTTPKKKPQIYIVTVPKANQAQIRFGRFLNQGEYENQEVISLGSEYLGGGFTSRLMREIRVKRGLSYTVSAYAGGQRQYGRSVISTFTKQATVGELLEVVKNNLTDIEKNGLKEEDISRARGALAGSFPFRFEKSSAYVQQLMHLDDINKSYDELYKFPSVVKDIKPEEVAKSISDTFNWNNQTIIIVGPKSLKKQVAKYGDVKIVNYKKFF